MKAAFRGALERRRLRQRMIGPRGFRRLDVHVQQLEDLPNNQDFTEYLAAANLRIVRADSRQPIRARIAQFNDMTFVHSSVPPLVSTWTRDHGSLDRALLIMARRGAVSVAGEETIISRGARAHLLLPGSRPMTIMTKELGTELTYMSIPATLLDGIEMPDQSVDRGYVKFSTIAPAYLFTTSMCAMSMDEVHDPEPLHSAAREIVRSILRMVFGIRGDIERSRYGYAMEIILREFASPDLDTHQVSAQLGISTRLLQLAFQERDTTFSAELRKVRAAAARNLKKEQPHLTLKELAKQTGFGSVPSLQRALRRGS